MAFHPDLAWAARLLPYGVGRRWFITLDRWAPKAPRPRLPPGFTFEERVLDAPTSARVRIFAPPASGAPRPAVLWIHGGGYVVGTAANDDRVCLRIAERTGAVVVSVDYRLAPEHPYPAALDDCAAAYALLHREAQGLGIDPARVVIAGQSAGGGLAAALTLRVHDEGGPRPCLQLLVYPMLDDRTCDRPIDGSELRVWDQPSNRLGWESYLAKAPGGPDVSDHAAPARRQDLSGLAPAWIGVGTLDLFYAEDLDYAQRLRQAGVPVELEVVEGAFHGFEAVIGWAPVSQRFIESQIAAMAAAMQPGGAAAGPSPQVVNTNRSG